MAQHLYGITILGQNKIAKSDLAHFPRANNKVQRLWRANNKAMAC